MSHFTLIPLDNYKTRNPLSLVVSGFSLFFASCKIHFGQVLVKYFSKEMLHLFYSLSYSCSDYTISSYKFCNLSISDFALSSVTCVYKSSVIAME